MKYCVTRDFAAERAPKVLNTLLGQRGIEGVHVHILLSAVTDKNLLKEMKWFAGVFLHPTCQVLFSFALNEKLSMGRMAGRTKFTIKVASSSSRAAFWVKVVVYIGISVIFSFMGDAAFVYLAT